MSLTPKQILHLNDRIKKTAEKQAGIDAEKVQRTVSSYLQIAKDSQLNYNELLQVFTIMKDTVLHSLNTLPISASVAANDDTANV